MDKGEDVKLWDLWQVPEGGSAPAEPPPRPWTVSELTKRIRWVLEEKFPEVWVCGEISNFRAAPSGHVYFTLKDSEAVLSCVLFREESSRITFAVADGQEVIARGRVTVYDARGQYQLVVRDLQPRGSGSLYQKFEAMKRRLAAEGLFDLARKRSLPIFPERIGLVTSLAGAVVQDFLRILRRRAPGIRVEIRDVRVQGATAAEEIASAIRAFGEKGRVDVVVIARGGGSIEDLWAFNEEVVARALAACPIPTVSAIGHETDFTIADFVADLRAPTPSAAAEMICRDWAQWEEVITGYEHRLHQSVARQLRFWTEKVERFRSHYAFREPRQVLERLCQRLDEKMWALTGAAERNLQERVRRLEILQERWQWNLPKRRMEQIREQLQFLGEKLAALGPQGTLKRGYALVWDLEGRIVREADAKLLGKRVFIDVFRGRLKARVEEVEEGLPIRSP